MVMAGRFERTVRGRRLRVTPMTNADMKRPFTAFTTFTTRVHDLVQSVPGSKTSHQSDRYGDRSCASPPNRPTATRGTTTPAPA